MCMNEGVALGLENHARRGGDGLHGGTEPECDHHEYALEFCAGQGGTRSRSERRPTSPVSVPPCVYRPGGNWSRVGQDREASDGSPVQMVGRRSP